MDNSYGFIILRHVNSEQTNKYWNTCVKCLRRLYSFRKIVIIDDNSNKEFLNAEHEYKNIEIIQSEFPKRGELLPYYYYLKNKFFENAIIIHDSVFFHKRIHFEKIIGIDVLPMWYFDSDKENVTNTIRISSSLTNNVDIQQKLLKNEMLFSLINSNWYGCFGVQCFISHKFLTYLEQKYNISKMIYQVTCRADRCSLERIFGALFYTECKTIQKSKSILGNIQLYKLWGYTYDNYEKDIKNKKLPVSIIKVWTGR